MRRLAPAGPELTIDFEGKPAPGPRGRARRLRAARRRGDRLLPEHQVPPAPRAVLHGGSCSNCLVRIDGVPNRFACQTTVRPGMHVERQNAYPSVRMDVFSSIDWLFPKGMDHHSMFAGVPVAEKVMMTVARHLAGLGLLPDAAPADPPPAERISTEVVVVGAGAAGLAAAEVLAARGPPAPRPRAGGPRRVAAWCSTRPRTARRGAPAVPPGAQLRLDTSVLGFYDDELGPPAARRPARRPRALGCCWSRRG